MSKERALEALHYLDGMIRGMRVELTLSQRAADDDRAVQSHIDALHKFITEGETK